MNNTQLVEHFAKKSLDCLKAIKNKSIKHQQKNRYAGEKSAYLFISNMIRCFTNKQDLKSLLAMHNHYMVRELNQTNKRHDYFDYLDGYTSAIDSALLFLSVLTHQEEQDYLDSLKTQ